MSLKQRFVHRSKKLAMSPPVMRWVSDDRVMKAAEGVMDARGRVKEAGRVLRDGHELPAIDPALDDSIAEEVDEDSSYPAARPTNGTATSGAAITDAPPGQTTSERPSQAGHASEQGKVEKTVTEALRQRGTVAAIGGKDIFEKCGQFKAADNARKVGIYPYFKPLDYNDGPEAVIDGKRVTMFGSNNYLGLTTHPEVRKSAQEAIDRFGTSMTGSRLVNGSMKLHNEFEEKLADWFGKESALVFTTGYQVNVAALSALLSNKSNVAVIDRNVHASLYDGCRLGMANGAKLVRFRHANANALDRALSRLDDAEGALVITDGVFSAEGEIAKLDEIVPVVKKHGARIFVDEAHARGVSGPEGRGTAHHFGLEDDVDLIGGTFSKSMASIGGYLVGDRKVLEYVQHFAPSFMFAASAAPPCVAAAMKAFDMMREEPWRQEKLKENFTYMRTELTRLGFELGHTETAVIPIYIRQDLRTLMMWRDLLEDYGVYTNAFISPGVPPKNAMLRTSYMATHERKHLDRGLEALEKVGKKYGVI